GRAGDRVDARWQRRPRNPRLRPAHRAARALLHAEATRAWRAGGDVDRRGRPDGAARALNGSAHSTGARTQPASAEPVSATPFHPALQLLLQRGTETV